MRCQNNLLSLKTIIYVNFIDIAQFKNLLHTAILKRFMAIQKNGKFNSKSSLMNAKYLPPKLFVNTTVSLIQAANDFHFLFPICFMLAQARKSLKWKQLKSSVEGGKNCLLIEYNFVCLFSIEASRRKTETNKIRVVSLVYWSQETYSSL